MLSLARDNDLVLYGSFKVVSSSLRAQVDREIADPVDVPEPMSLALLGLGLAGIAGMRRKV